jgi:hypothetical protein
MPGSVKRTAQWCILRRRHDNIVRSCKLSRNVSREKAIGRNGAAADDRYHSDHHVPADGHAVENEVIVAAHEEHRRVHQHPAGHQGDAEDERPQSSSVSKGRSAKQLPRFPRPA